MEEGRIKGTTEGVADGGIRSKFIPKEREGRTGRGEA